MKTTNKKDLNNQIIRDITIKIGFLLTVLIIWELVARYGGVSETLFPPFTLIIRTLLENIKTGEIIQHTGYSLYLIFTGIGIGIFLAFILTAFYMVYRPFATIMDVVISIMHPLPGIALLPLIMLLFGLGAKAIIIVIVHSVIWPLIVNTVTGFRSVPKTHLELGRNIGMSEFKLICSVMIPNAFPYIF